MAGEQGGQAPGGPAPAGIPAGSSLDAAIEAELESMGAADDSDEQDEQQRPTNEADDQAQDNDQADDQQQDDDQADDDAEADQPELKAGEDEAVFDAPNGKKYVVPRELAQGYMRHQDYTQKTMSFAEHVRTHEAQLQQLYAGAAHLQQHRSQIAQIDAAIAQGYQYLQENPDLSQRDAVEFSRITGQLTLAQNRRQQLEGEMRQADQQYRDYEARQTQERVAKVAPQLAAIGLTPDKLQVVEQHLRAYGAPQEAIDYLSGCSAPWAVVMAADSLMYRQLMAQRAKATTKVDNAKRSSVLTPGAASTPQSRPGNTVKRTHQRMVATGSVNDAVAHELALMERRTGSGTRRR